MLHESITIKSYTVGFDKQVNINYKTNKKYQNIYKKIVEVNKFFTGKTLASRNFSGSHMQNIINDKAHAFMYFGYHGEREYKILTKGVACCASLIKIIDKNRNVINNNNKTKMKETIKEIIKDRTNVHNQFSDLHKPTFILDIQDYRTIRKNIRKAYDNI